MKNLIRNAIRSFKTNKISLVGLVFLLFFGLGAFCTMSNTTANIKNEYSSISSSGNLHDFTAAELYDIGNPSFLPHTKGIVYETNSLGQLSGDAQYKTIEEFIALESQGLSTSKLYGGAELPKSAGTFFIPVPEQTIQQITGEEPYYIVSRTYHIVLSPNTSTGLYKNFAENEKVKSITSFNFKVSTNYEKTEDFPASVIDFYHLLNDETVTQDLINKCAASNVFSLDYQAFSQFMNDKTQSIYSTMMVTDTPLASHLQKEYSKELDYRFFKSLNVTATQDNIFYKIIESNVEDKIDTMVLFNDPANRQGNNLFSTNDWAPYNSELVIKKLDGSIYEAGSKIDDDFIIPSTFNDVATTKLFSLEEMEDANWSNEKKFAYTQIMQIRFKRMLAADISANGLEDLLKKVACINLDANQYYKDFFEKEELMEAYDEYLNDWFKNGNESITISANGNVVFGWTGTFSTPKTCTLTNWTGRFSIVNPQHLQAVGKRVLDPSILNNFLPFRTWYKATYNRECGGEIRQEEAKAWFNSLTSNQISFWINPWTKNSWTTMVYDNIPYGASITVTRGDKDGQWNGIDKEFIAKCGGYDQIIWGCGITPDFIYPIVDISRPTPNVKTECLVYSNSVGYNTIKLAFINSPVEEYLLARFKPNVNTNRRQEILDEINAWAKKNMIFPKEIKCAYFANDTTNVLNSAGFRIAYIPNLVKTIDIVSIILCSFIGILAFIICFVIIKRYVERNRVNIGIMRANGIPKWKIALSLFPFALFPAIIGGIAAYFTGLLLQAPCLTLFKNYWTLPTPLIKFDWVSLIVCIALPFLIFAVICFVATLIVLRTKSVELMKAGSEFKTNSFSRVVKKPFKSFGILTRFRVSLAFNSVNRLVIMALMSCLTMTSLVFAFTTFDKLNQSKAINSSQFDYKFSLKLTTPTASGSTYNTYDYDGLGKTDPNQYLYNVNWNTAASGAVDYNEYSYDELTRWYSYESLTTAKTEIIGKNGNIMLPSAADMMGQNLDLMYLADKTCSRLTLDYNLGVSQLGITSNPWEIALALMPSNSRNLAADSYNKIINMIGANVSKATEIFEEKMKGKDRSIKEEADKAAIAAGKWCYVYNDGTILSPNYVNGLSQYFDYNSESNTYSLNKHSWLAGFDEPFTYMIVTAYRDQDIIRNEYPIAYRQIPINWETKNDTVKKDELYTYIEANICGLSSNARYDSNAQITIEGIPADSRFVFLTNDKGQEINSYLFSENYLNSMNVSEGVHPLIVNAYAAHKYGLKVGSTIEIKANNMAERFNQKIHPEKFDSNWNKAKFKVVGISVGTNGESFYTTQKVANDVLGLPNGHTWNKTHKYMRWESQDDYDAGKPAQLVDLAGIGASQKYITKYSFNSDGESAISEPKIDTESIPRKNDRVPVGFNGIYTADPSGKPLTNVITLYSYTGMYPGTSVYKTKSSVNKFAEILSNGANLGIANLMSGIDDPKYYQECDKYTKIEEPTEKEKADYLNVINEFIDKLVSIYGDTTMITAICGAMDVAASDLIYSNLISTFDLAQTSIMSIIIPITIIIVGIISNLIIIDSKKMAAMLKALGYSDAKNLMSILAMFIPTIVFGLLLAIPLSFGITLGYQSLIFGGANILVDVTQKWWYYVAAVGGIGIILLATYAIGYASIKRDRLVDQIK